ncbi:MAG: DUF1822 family protein [Coleofasciculus sp. S288]|nr:DUF1822 family protein [Coleofasciculus sp. S288]
MIYSAKTMKDIKENSIPLSITTTALRTAEQFAAQALTPEKREQVYFNTLAVCVVNDYMEMMDIPTDLKASDSWNSAMRLYADVADLNLTGLGHLECRPIRSGNSCYIPREVPDDRIGIVVVEINPEHQEATLLGFTQTVRTGELSISELQTVDDLLAHLDRLEHKLDKVNLSQWLQNIFEAGWQSVEEIVAPKTLALAFRRYEVKRGKLIDLGIQLSGQSVALIVTLTPKTEAEIRLKVQVYPTGEQLYLPSYLSLKVLDEEVTVMEAQAGSANTHMTLEFGAQLGERFSVSLELGELSLTEKFVV